MSWIQGLRQHGVAAALGAALLFSKRGQQKGTDLFSEAIDMI